MITPEVPTEVPTEIPEGATVNYATFKRIPTDGPFSDATITCSSEDGYRATYGSGRSTLDVTDKYIEWLDTLPLHHTVTFEWVVEPTTPQNSHNKHTL